MHGLPNLTLMLCRKISGTVRVTGKNCAVLCSKFRAVKRFTAAAGTCLSTGI